MQTTSAEFPRLAREALARETLQGSLRGLRHAMPAMRAAALADFPEFASVRAAAARIREATLGSLDHHLDRFESQVIAAGGHVHRAANAAQACEIVARICGEGAARAVIKSKSMVTEEIELNAALESRGLQVTETDLGEYIIQLRGERPSHILAPALHVSLAEVGRTFERHHSLARDHALEDAGEMLAEARAVLREVFLRADVGITGANFLVAETGGVVLVTNEGNADLTASLPATHIVVTGIEKVVPTLEDAGVLLKLLARSAIGEPLSSYTTLIHGPKRAADGSAAGSLHVVLVDNGRRRLLGTPLQDILRCIRCSACLNHCPVYSAVGGHAYGSVYSGPMGAVLTPGLAGIAAAAHLPAASTLCGRCETVCPVGIPILRLLRYWREQWQLQAAATDKRALAWWRALATRPWLYRMALSLAAKLLYLASIPGARPGRRWLRRLPPPLDGWTRFRDLAAPEGRTFQARWRQRRMMGKP